MYLTYANWNFNQILFHFSRTTPSCNVNRSARHPVYQNLTGPQHSPAVSATGVASLIFYHTNIHTNGPGRKAGSGLDDIETPKNNNNHRQRDSEPIRARGREKSNITSNPLPPLGSAKLQCRPPTSLRKWASFLQWWWSCWWAEAASYLARFSLPDDEKKKNWNKLCGIKWFGPCLRGVTMEGAGRFHYWRLVFTPDNEGREVKPLTII